MRQADVLRIIAVALLFPLFFQLSGDIYNSQTLLVDSGGMLNKLPLPISVLACFGGIVLLRNNYQRAFIAFKFVSAMLLAMLASLVLAGPDLYIDKHKVILLAQFMMPVFALVLGQMVIDDQKTIPKAFLGVLLVVVPVQLAASWFQGHFTLTHYLYVFSVYQHFQFVPLIFVCAYAYTLSELWDIHRKACYWLIPLMTLYVIASLSFLTIFAFMLFSFMFVYTRPELKTNKKIWSSAAAAAVIAGVLLFSGKLKDSGDIDYSGGQYYGKFHALITGTTPSNLKERLADWKLFSDGIVESGRTLMVGHPAPIPREQRSSAHNWYLDMAYTFGLLALLPVVLLTVYSIGMLWRLRDSLPSTTLWLGSVVLFLVVIDSNFKVTLRQPYPGIFTFFMWGLLLSALQAAHRQRKI